MNVTNLGTIIDWAWLVSGVNWAIVDDHEPCEMLRSLEYGRLLSDFSKETKANKMCLDNVLVRTKIKHNKFPVFYVFYATRARF